MLLRRDSEIRLRRKAYECLRYLIEQSPRAVSKDELCEAVWSPRIISNETLTSTIKDIRQALDDQLEPRRYVRTLFGFGYRFMAQVLAGREGDGPSAARPADAQPLEQA